jgi:hypothetical protein
MSVEFDPVRLDRRRRRLDPVVVGAIVVVIALVVAVAKPWGGDDSGTPADADAAAASAISPSASGAADGAMGPTPATGTAGRAPIWADVSPVVTSHDAWGVRAILSEGRAGLASDSPIGYSERWIPATLDSTGRTSVYIERDERSMVVLGVSAPLDARAQDARVWRVHRDDRLEWVDAVQLLSGHVDASFLFVRPGTDGTLPYVGWLPGTYRIDVLTLTGIARIEIRIPGRFGDVPPLDDAPPPPTVVPGAAASQVDAILGGMFATVDGSAVPLDAVGYRPLTEREAWLDVALAEGAFVATAYLPRATGLGVMFAPGDDITGSAIRRLAPGERFDAPRPFNGMSDRQGGVLYVLFPAPDGVWEPGVYAVTVDWTDQSGEHESTWHVELLPGIG